MKVVVAILMLLFNTFISPSYAQDSTCYSDLILAGINHPRYKADTKAIPSLAETLLSKSPYFSVVCTFSTGKELLEILKEEKRKGYVIRNLLIMGHSGFQGYFVEELAGFYRNGYEVKEGGKVYYPKDEAATVDDLKCAVENGEIAFSNDAIIVLSGCNTTYGKENIAKDLANTLKVPVVGPNQKVDLFNVEDLGEDLKGLEGRSFYAYLPMEDGRIKLFDFAVDKLKVSDAITIVKEKMKGMESGVIK